MEKVFEPLEGRNLEIINTIMSSSEIVDLPEDIKFDITLCVEEIEENILCYSGSTWVKVWTNVDTEGYVEIGFRDGGVKFDPLAKPDPDIHASVTERQVGGLGIFLCKQMMDEVNYQFKNNCNVFTMKKRISRA